MEEHDYPVRRSRWEKTKLAFSSWSAFHSAIKLKSAASMLANEDLLPSPIERQTWTVWNFFAYWYVLLKNIPTRLGPSFF